MDINLNAAVNIQYEKSYVAFLDVLGFKNLVFSNKQSDKAKLNQYRTTNLFFEKLVYLFPIFEKILNQII